MKSCAPLYLIFLLALESCFSGGPGKERTQTPTPRVISVVANGSTKRTLKQKINPAQIRKDDPDWKRAELEVDSNQEKIDARLAALSRAETERFVLRRGNTKRNTIALTFDDGPHPAATLKLLDILSKEGVPATFFVVGFMADKYPDLIRAIKAAGQEIGNHTYSHVTLTRIPADQAMVEYKATNDVIRRITGSSPRYCRPPGGDFNRAVLRNAAELGLTTVLWTDDPGDYTKLADKAVFNREVARLKPGGIILLHDGAKSTLKTLPAFIRTARGMGFKFVTLDELKSPKREK